MGAWRRQHKNFSNRPETCALGISPGEGEPSREFGGGSAFQNRFGRTVGVPVSVTVSPPTRHTQRNRM